MPHLARACRELYVFQRTPSSVDVRANAPIDPDWFASIATGGWQQRWLENFTANQAGGAGHNYGFHLEPIGSTGTGPSRKRIFMNPAACWQPAPC